MAAAWQGLNNQSLLPVISELQFLKAILKGLYEHRFSILNMVWTERRVPGAKVAQKPYRS